MKNLKQLRKERELSQQQLAEVFSVTQQSIYKYENSLAEPNLKTLIQMAEFFHTTVDYLIGRNNEKVTVDLAPLSQLEIHHLEMYRELSAADRRHIDGIIDALSSKKNP